MGEGSNYCWAVPCKNRLAHIRQSIFRSHRIALGRTDAVMPPPDLDRFPVQCDMCGEKFLYSPSDVRRYEYELPQSFTPHPLFGPCGDRRRSRRSEKGMGLVVMGESVDKEFFQEKTFSVSVNAHGGLIALASKVQLGQTLFLKNPQTQDEVEGRVVRVGLPHSGLAPVGVEFVQSDAEFWSVESQLAEKSTGKSVIPSSDTGESVAT
jgi:hypothetical protein